MSKKKDGLTGKMYPKSTMFLRTEVGECEDPNTGNKYEMSLGFSTSAPMILSRKTGKYFVLGWSSIIQQAIAAGIDKETK